MAMLPDHTAVCMMSFGQWRVVDGKGRTRESQRTVAVLERRLDLVRATEQRDDLFADLFHLSLQFRIRGVVCDGSQASVGVEVGPAFGPLWTVPGLSALAVQAMPRAQRLALTLLSILVSPHQVGTSNPNFVTGLSLFMLCRCISANLVKLCVVHPHQSRQQLSSAG